jgi:hypothetical protein
MLIEESCFGDTDRSVRKMSRCLKPKVRAVNKRVCKMPGIMIDLNWKRLLKTEEFTRCLVGSVLESV